MDTAPQEVLDNVTTRCIMYFHQLITNRLGSYLLQSLLISTGQVLKPFLELTDKSLLELIADEQASRVMITACDVDLIFRVRMISLLKRRWTSAVNVLSSALFIVESIKSYLKCEETGWMLDKLLQSRSRILESKYQKRILVAFLETYPSATTINRVWEEVILPYGLPSSLDDKCLT